MDIEVRNLKRFEGNGRPATKRVDRGMVEDNPLPVAATDSWGGVRINCWRG